MTSNTLTHNVHGPDVSDLHSGCEEQKQGNEATPVPGDPVRDTASSSGFATHPDEPDENEETIITSSKFVSTRLTTIANGKVGIRATDVALGLRRIPAGFYAVVQHSGLEWRTENKRLSVNNDIVEWDRPIPMPSDLSATIGVGIYASFEFQPMLGDGEQLRTLTITVEQLLNGSAEDLMFTFSPMDGDVVSPCSSLSVAVKRRKREGSDPPTSRAIDPHCSTTESRSQLEYATNEGHNFLSCYRKHGQRQDLDRSIEQYKLALGICPPDDPCCAATRSNVAMAKFIRCRVDNTDHSFDIPLGLYRDALLARPVGHLDRPSTLIQLAAVHFARFDKQRDEVDKSRAEELLHETMVLSSAESHEKRAAVLMLQFYTGREAGPVQGGARSSLERDFGSGLTDLDPWTSSDQLLGRFERSGDLDDLEQAISLLEACVRPASVWDRRYLGGLTNLGVALMYRFECLGAPSDLEQAISGLGEAADLTPDGHPDKLTRLNNLGNCFLTRFRCLGEQGDLEQAISKLGSAVDLTPDGHPGKPDRLSNLGNCFLTRFHKFGELGDLEQASSRIKDAADLVPDGHPHRPGYLSNLGNCFFTRFEHLGELGDLEIAILRFGNALDLIPDGHPDKPGCLNNLGNSFRARFQRLGGLSDLERGISWLQDAIDLLTDGHPDKPHWLNNLGSSFRARFERLGVLRDLEQAISRFRLAVDFTPDHHPDKPGRLDSLGGSFLTRFEHLGEPSDLEQAISSFRDAVDFTPDHHPDKPVPLNNLGRSLVARFEHLGELSDLEQAMSKLREAVCLTPDGHPDKPGRLSNLGNCFLTRFQRLGELSDIEQAVSTLGHAIDVTPGDHPDKPGYLSNLGNCFLTRFERLGELSDLEHATSKLGDAVHLTPDGHPDKPGCLNNLGNCFLTRFERLGGLPDLEKAISKFGDAVYLTPDCRPDKAGRLNNLGNSFLARFQRLGELRDVEHAISKQRDAVDLTPDHSPDKPGYLCNLGSSFKARFERLGELSDLEQAISREQDAVALSPDRHPRKSMCLDQLGSSFLIRFERLGELSDLEQAISRFRDAVNLIPDGHPEKPVYMSNVGSSFLKRFERLGELGDIEQAISRQRDAVDLIPDGHSKKANTLNSLGNAFSTRFRRLGELSDLEQAISRFRNAVDFTPDGHPEKPSYLNNLGSSFIIRFQRLGELSDIEQAISKLEEVVDLTPEDHPDRPGRLNNLGNPFLARFARLGELGDIEQAISRQRDAVDLTPDTHPHKPGYLSNLGSCFFTRFEHLGELGDLEQAISRFGDAVHLTPDGHPEEPGRLNSLGNSFLTRFEHLGELCDLEQATSLYSRAACATTGPTSHRFRASQNWISCARLLRHRSLLHAYAFAIDLLPQLAWIGLALTDRYRELTQGADVVREAAAAALDSGRPELAVEWLEQGRSIIWGELFQLRSSYDELLAVHPGHASRLRELSVALEHAGIAREKFRSSPLEQTETLEREADIHRMLAIERDTLLQEIRGLPGFERFLLRQEFSRLRTSAHSGPVVILNAAKTRCDALIVLSDMDNVIHVPLPKFTLERSESLQTSMKSLIRRDGKSIPHETPSEWEPILSALWKCVVKPVLHSLAISTPEDLARIFWCPTGPFTFLPIHAAGFYATEYSRPGHKVFDFIVSSYVPTLSILMPSPELRATSSSGLRFLAVRQSPSDGLSKLPGVHAELEYIKGVIQSSPSAQTTFVEPSLGTVEEVLGMMKEADWVHFACHGIQDAANPTDSGLCLANRRRLKLPDIITLSRPRGGLAFLSACQTATGDKKLSDEAIHIAAGMLFAGYGGVVGTMWSISDKLAPGVARDVYEQLFRKGTMPDYREAARALQDAVRSLRDGGASFREWLPFIHVGL